MSDGVDQEFDPDLILLSGYAQVPRDVAAYAHYQTLGMVVVVRRSSGVVVDAESTLVTSVARGFIRTLLVGLSLVDDGVEIQQRIAQHYLGHTRGAVSEAMRRIVERYRELP